MQIEKKMSSNKKTNLSWRRFLAIPGVFPYPLLVFHNAVSTLFLLLWWKSHNGRYWLLYFLSVYPPLAFVIAEQEDMPDRGAMLSRQNLNIFFFFLIILNPVGSRGGMQEGRCRGSGCLGVGVAMQSARSPGLLRICERWALLLKQSGQQGQVCSLVCTCAVNVAGVPTDMCIRKLQLPQPRAVKQYLSGCTHHWACGHTHTHRLYAKKLLF